VNANIIAALITASTSVSIAIGAALVSRLRRMEKKIDHLSMSDVGLSDRVSVLERLNGYSTWKARS
jgi:hypothetical protein